MMIDSKTKWSVWGMLFGMAVVLGAGVAFLAFILTRDPQILAFLYDKITDYTVAFVDGDATVKVGGYNTKTKVYENGTYVRTVEDAPDGFIWEP